ncbi:MAG TPA: hypothetical protein VIP51_08285 [Eoetvoesiella sp.]
MTTCTITLIKLRFSLFGKRCRSLFLWVFILSIFPAFVALTGTVAGLWASIYGPELKAALLALWNSQFDSIQQEAWIGISLVVVFFLLYALQQSAKNMQEADAKRKLFAETDKLRLLVERLETMPPDGFLQKFQDLYREISELGYIPVQEGVTQEIIEEAIRSVLDAIATLAYQFDGAPNGQKYAANLMLCRAYEHIMNLSEQEKANIEQRLIFCPDIPSPKLDSVKAVLDLIPQLSSDFKYPEGDSQRTPSIALPVGHDLQVNLGPDSGLRYKVLPGAPFVAMAHQYAAFESIGALLGWCQDKADFTQTTINEIRNYFHDGKGKHIKSFIAVPICIRTAADDQLPPCIGGLAIDIGAGGTKQREYCLAVLNIHSKSEDILGASGYGMFVPIIEPFVKVLSHLLETYVYFLYQAPDVKLDVLTKDQL